MLKDKNKFALCAKGQLAICRENIQKRGLEIGKIEMIDISLFGYKGFIYFGYQINEVYLIEVKNNINIEKIEEFKARMRMKSEITKPLQDDGYQATIKVLKVPEVIEAESLFWLTASIQNKGNSIWNALGSENGKYQINVSYHWLNKKGEILLYDGMRTPLPEDIYPGEEILVDVLIQSPEIPGNYLLRIDLVQEMVTWFESRGSLPAELEFKITSK
ncbi:MAG: hypothetical protein A2Y62_10535 [Candidatus Fischerbacteria bacterium RBG_13_37_8]|uniref:Intracellular proteinase inhibitor BsuPI domain-containing protein n=1 Tax=Candidatus Fischerbacteria bacterium RBG_13_37_8 TaxID=1817863 RepID=A0A1F5VQZ0_9BACT|nr:MAG: hypothetical protein A2Y62_10535 [Candidatus Fischerbacteria bacterium RBG_13_37_8]